VVEQLCVRSAWAAAPSRRSCRKFDNRTGHPEIAAATSGTTRQCADGFAVRAEQARPEGPGDVRPDARGDPLGPPRGRPRPTHTADPRSPPPSDRGGRGGGRAEQLPISAHAAIGDGGGEECLEEAPGLVWWSAIAHLLRPRRRVTGLSVARPRRSRGMMGCRRRRYPGLRQVICACWVTSLMGERIVDALPRRRRVPRVPENVPLIPGGGAGIGRVHREPWRGNA
jgi:hypothetical protein